MTPVQLPEVPALTPAERGFIEVVRINASRKIIGISERAVVFGFPVSFSWRSRKNPLGRFGGGWQWKLGFQAGGGTVIVSILVCELRIDRRRPTHPTGAQQ